MAWEDWDAGISVTKAKCLYSRLDDASVLQEGMGLRESRSLSPLGLHFHVVTWRTCENHYCEYKMSTMGNNKYREDQHYKFSVHLHLLKIEVKVDEGKGENPCPR